MGGKVKKGFTLVEVLVALAIMSVIGLTITGLYATITSYAGRRNEMNNLKYTLHNIHEYYLADPENWESNYFELYEVDFSGLDYSDQIIYYNRDFNRVLFNESKYVIHYEYSYQDNEASLIIKKIIREDVELDKNIDFGNWIKREP